MSILDSMRWRYATKKFDSTKKISDQDLANLKEAIRLAPSSYGFQLFKVLIVTDPEIKKKLYKESYLQSQVKDCSHLFVFCSYKTVNNDHIDEFTSLMEEYRKQDKEQGITKTLQSKAKILAYGAIAKTDLGSRKEEDLLQWMKKQCYIAMTHLLVACADKRIDACPFEGFRSAQYDKILGLENRNLTSTVLVPVGFRSEEDYHQHRSKVRKPLENIFEEL